MCARSCASVFGRVCDSAWSGAPPLRWRPSSEAVSGVNYGTTGASPETDSQPQEKTHSHHQMTLGRFPGQGLG